MSLSPSLVVGGEREMGLVAGPPPLLLFLMRVCGALMNSLEWASSQQGDRVLSNRPGPANMDPPMEQSAGAERILQIGIHLDLLQLNFWHLISTRQQPQPSCRDLLLLKGHPSRCHGVLVLVGVSLRRRPHRTGR